MDKVKREKELKEAIELLEKIDKLDVGNFDLKVPYSEARTPKPKQWKVKGLQHKLR